MHKKLLFIPLILLLGACSQSSDLEMSHNSSGDITTHSKQIYTNDDLEEGIKLKEILATKERLRGGIYSEDYEYQVGIPQILDNNMVTLREMPLYILGTNTSSQPIVLTANADGSVWGAESKNNQGTVFHSLSYWGQCRIWQDSPTKKYLGSGVWRRSRNEKTSIAYMRLPAEEKDMLGTDWKLIPKKNGLIFECTRPYLKDEKKEATYDNIENRVLTCSNLGGKIILASQEKDNASQLFTISPKGDFKILGIRYFAHASDFSDGIYKDELIKTIGDETIIKKGFSETTHKVEDLFFDASIKRLADIKVERTYRNETYQEVPVDMFFDKTVNDWSYFDEIKSISIESLKQAKFPTPSIIGGDIVFRPKNPHTSKSTYPYTSFTTKELKGALYLLVSPRSEARVEYTYSVYSVRLPYIIFLSPRNGNSKRNIKIIGIWTGTLYTEHDTDRHHFSKRPLDKQIEREGNDDEIDFDLSNEELRSLGYRESTESFRSATTKERKRIRL